MANTKNTQEFRFRIIETLLLWEGQVDNQRLRTLLGVQSVQASRILAEYAENYKDSASRPSPRAPYEASTSLKPILSSGQIEEYLALVEQSGGLEDGLIEDARMNFGEPDPRIFSVLLRASRQQMGVIITYRSMNTPIATTRLIYPHTIIRAARRWHVRAWCDKRLEYRDFVIGRITSAKLTDHVAVHQMEGDRLWQKSLKIIVGAHPALSPEQARVIRDEYFNGAVSRRLSVRACQISYIIQDLRIALDIEHDHPPDFQLAVTNLNALRPYLFDTKQQTAK